MTEDQLIESAKALLDLDARKALWTARPPPMPDNRHPITLRLILLIAAGLIVVILVLWTPWPWSGR